MEIAVISDIHANFAALDSVISRLNERGVTDILCSGDIVGYYGSPNEVIKLLEEEKVKCVRGNHDEAVLEGIPQNFRDTARFTLNWTQEQLTEESTEYLYSLPIERVEKYGSTTISLVHGSPQNPLTEYVYEDTIDEVFVKENFISPPDFAVLGHTHESFVKKIGQTTIVNPGSVGQPRDGEPSASFAIIDTDYETASRYRVEYDIDDTINKVKSNGFPEILADRLKKGR
jgi:putative phosphoesterase